MHTQTSIYVIYIFKVVEQATGFIDFRVWSFSRRTVVHLLAWWMMSRPVWTCAEWNSSWTRSCRHTCQVSSAPRWTLGSRWPCGRGTGLRTPRASIFAWRLVLDSSDWAAVSLGPPLHQPPSSSLFWSLQRQLPFSSRLPLPQSREAFTETSWQWAI